MRRLFYWALRGLSVLYLLICLLSLALIPISARGWFGVEPDPLSAVPAIFLGTPWSILFVRLFSDHGMTAAMAMIISAMAINGLLLWLLGSAVRPPRQHGKD